jgi:hypothetical protein
VIGETRILVNENVLYTLAQLRKQLVNESLPEAYLSRQFTGVIPLFEAERWPKEGRQMADRI